MVVGRSHDCMLELYSSVALSLHLAFPLPPPPLKGPCYVAQTSFELLILLLQLLECLRYSYALPSLALPHSLCTELAEAFEAHFIMCSVEQVVKLYFKRNTTLDSFLEKDFEFGAQKTLRWSVLWVRDLEN